MTLSMDLALDGIKTSKLTMSNFPKCTKSSALLTDTSGNLKDCTTDVDFHHKCTNKYLGLSMTP